MEVTFNASSLSVSQLSDDLPINVRQPEKQEPGQPWSHETYCDFHRHLAEVSDGYATKVGMILVHCPDKEQSSIGLELLTIAAKNADKTALLYLAIIFLEGVLAEKNWLVAMNYLLREYTLKMQQGCFSNGYEKELMGRRKHAFSLLQKDVNEKVPDAMYCQAMLLLKGVLSTSNPMFAINNLLQPASEHGHSEASHELGMIYLEGRYGIQQSANGIYYLQRAASQGREEKFLIKETLDVPALIPEPIPPMDSNAPLQFVRIWYKGKQHWAPAVTGICSATVKKLVFATGKEYFYKPFFAQRDSISPSALHAGIPIDPFARNIPYRAMFAYQLAEHLGFQVIPKTGLIHQDNDCPGYILEKAPGVSAFQLLYVLNKCDDIDAIKSNPIIGRKLVQLQISDAISGEPDRHGNNLNIDLETNQVFGFDNDYCGGKNIAHPYHVLPLWRYDGFVPGKLTEFEKNLMGPRQSRVNEAISHFLNQPDSAGRGVLLPPIMDEDMVDRVSRLTNEDLVRIMTPLYFTDAEIKAAHSRLKVLHDHIAMLKQRQEFGGCAIIKPDEWGSPKVQEIMYPDASGNAFPIHTNYLSREIAIASGKNTYKDLITDWAPVGGKKNAHDLMKMTESELKSFKQKLNLS